MLEDPWDEPPADAFAWTIDPARRPNEPEYVEIEFEQGRPIGLDGERLDGVPLIERLNKLGGKHGVGRIDHVENRLVGIKIARAVRGAGGGHPARRPPRAGVAVPEQAAARFKT